MSEVGSHRVTLETGALTRATSVERRCALASLPSPTPTPDTTQTTNTS